MKRKSSSLHDLICWPTISALVANMRWLSSCKLTPPMAATSLMSSSSRRVDEKLFFFSFSLEALTRDLDELDFDDERFGVDGAGVRITF